MITIKKMTEMKEKIYPTLPVIRESPTAPDIRHKDIEHRDIELKDIVNINNSDGHTYRLKVISDVQKFLETEINNRDAFSKKYFRVAKIVSNIDNVLIGITVCAEGVGAVLLATGVGAPFALGVGIAGAATGAISLIGNIAVNKTIIKAEKHLKIKVLANAK